MILTKTFTFESAHLLPGHPKCGVCHGHSWKLKVSIQGEPGNNGMIIDFHDLKSIVQYYLLDKLDHKFINEQVDFIPTCENLVVWTWKQLEEPLNIAGVKLQNIKLCETPDNCISYEK